MSEDSDALDGDDFEDESDDEPAAGKKRRFT